MSINYHHCNHHHCHHHQCHHSSVCEFNCFSCPVHSLSSSLNNGHSLYKSASSYDIFKQNGFNSFNVNSNNSTCNTFDDMNNFRGMSSQGFDLQRCSLKGNDELKQLELEPQMKRQFMQKELQQQLPLGQDGNEIDYKDMLNDTLKLLRTISDVSGKGNNIKDVDYYVKHKPEFKNEIQDDIKWVNSLIGINNKEGIPNVMYKNNKESEVNNRSQPKMNENLGGVNNNNYYNVYPNTNTNLKMLDDKLKNKRFDIGNDFANPNRGIAGVTNPYTNNNNGNNILPNNSNNYKDVNINSSNNNNSNLYHGNIPMNHNNTNKFINDEVSSNSNQFNKFQNNSNNEVMNLPFNKNDKLKSKKREYEYPNNNQQLLKEHQNNPLNNEDFTLRQTKSENNNNNNNNIPNHNPTNMIYQTPQFGDTNVMGYQFNKDKFPKNENQFNFTMKNSKIKPPQPEEQFFQSQTKFIHQEPPIQQNNNNLLLKNPITKPIIPGDSYNQRQTQLKQTQNNKAPINPKQPILNNNNQQYINNNNNSNSFPYNGLNDKEFLQQNPNLIPNQQKEPFASTSLSNEPYTHVIPNNANQKLPFKEHSHYRSNSNSPDQKYINPNYKHKVLKKNNSYIDGNKLPNYNNDNLSKAKMNNQIINQKYNVHKIESSPPMKNAYVTKTKPKTKKEYYHHINNSFSGNCFACEVGCNVSNTGYSPMTFSPYNPNIRRRNVTPLKGEYNN